MKERDCTSASKAYGILREAFKDPFAAGRVLENKGKSLVWTFGDDVPEEIIIACGMIPVRLFGSRGECPNADKYLEASFGPLWRGNFESVVQSRSDCRIKNLIMSNSSDLIQKLYYYFLQLARLEPERKMPQIYYIDYSLMVKDFSAQERNIRESRAFLSYMEEISGKQIDAENLKKAVKLCNRYRSALRKLQILRQESRLLGSEALTAFAGSFLMEKNEAAELIEQLAEDVEKWPKTELMPVVYTGSVQESTEVYCMMEQSGLNVVAEDKIPGWRYCDQDVEENPVDPVAAITLRYHLRFPSSERGYVLERENCIPELVKRVSAKGLVVFMNHNDESYIWDLPAQRKILESRDIAVLTAENQTLPLTDCGTLMEMFSAFAKEGGCCKWLNKNTKQGQ